MVLMRVKHLDASENLRLSLLSYQSLLNSRKWGEGVVVLGYFFSPSPPAVLVIIAVAYVMDYDSSVELLSIYSFFSGGLYCYIAEHLWACFCVGVCLVIQELKIGVCFADLIMQVYTITVLGLTQINITLKMSYIVGANGLNN